MHSIENILRKPAQYDKNVSRVLTNDSFERIRKQLLMKIPRVLYNQKDTYEKDEFFRIISTDVPVRYANHIENDLHFRQKEFYDECQRGELTIVITKIGKNVPRILHLVFAGDGTPTSSQDRLEDGCNFHKEPGKVHVTSSFILNGVCVKFRGWLDVVKLEGMGRLEFDEVNATKEHHKIYGTQS